MPTRTQNVKLGLFLVVTAVLFVLVFVTVAQVSLFEDEHTYYVVSDESSAGLDVGAPVSMRGVRVGTVAAIELDREHLDSVRIELEIDDEISVPKDAVAHIEMSGLTGTRVVDIAGGDLRAGVLPPGSVIPLDPTLLDSLKDRSEELIAQATALLDQSQALMKNLVQITEAFSENMDPKRVDEMIASVETILTRLESSAETLESTLQTGQKGVKTLVADVHQTTDELQDILKQSDRMLGRNDQDLRKAIRSLRKTAENFEDLSRDLRRDPSRLIRSRPPKPRELP